MPDTDQRILYTEAAVGASHPSLTDVVNRPLLAFHDNAGRHLFTGGSTVASAATIAVPDDENYFIVSGTTTISAISGKSAGCIVTVRFTGNLTITHNATTLRCPGGGDIAIVAGDIVTFHEYSSGNWEIVGITNTESNATAKPNHKNAVHNGAMAIGQRGTSFTSATTYPNNDDAYTLDRWYILSDGNDIVDVTQETSTVPTNGLYAMALDVETANKKFGIAQIIEQKNCIGLIGNTVTLSFKAKVSATTNLDNVKAAIIAWSGTADTVTSDIISAWNIEGTDPTLIANATYENTPANLSLTTSYATYSISAAVDTASTKNIILFIWSDVTTTTVGGADILYITDVQLENGSIATDFEREAQGVTLAKCQRYFETIVGGATGTPFGSGYATTTAVVWAYVKYLPKRTIPSITNSTASNFRISYQATSTIVTSITYTAPSLSAVRANVTGTGTPLTVGEGGLFADNNGGAGILYIDSEM